MNIFLNDMQGAMVGRLLFMWVLLLSATLIGCANFDGTAQTPSPISFTDVASQVGLDFTQGAFRWGYSGDPIAMMGGGLCWLDFDNDGWLDLYAVNNYAVAEAGQWDAEGGLPTSALFHNNGGSFSDVSAETGVDLAMRGNGCVAADLNLDGFTDIYVTTSRVNLLLWNNGDGTFSEGATAAGVAPYGWQTAASVGDLNNDGWPDLFVAGYVDVNNQIEGSTMGFPNTNYGIRDLLYVSNGADGSGAVTFREVGELVGLETAEFEYGLGAVLSDVDGDHDLDLFVANDTNPNRLYINVPLADDAEGIGFRLVEQGSVANVNDSNSGMGVASADFDNNNSPDLFITNMGPQMHSMYQNKGASRAGFDDAAQSIGLTDFGIDWTGWGTSWGDFDLDSDLDLFVTHGAIPVTDLAADAMLAQVYGNLTAQGQLGQFENVSDAAGLGDFGRIVGRGSAVADYDNDGDLDVAINTIGGELALLRNDGATGNWLTVALEEFAPGAVVTVELSDGTTLRREVLAGSSYLASEDLRCHFGLGAAQLVNKLSVRWPDGSITTKSRIRVNQILHVQSDT